jgi:hypothetical protein
MIIVNLLYCCMFGQHWFKFPEDGTCVETCSSKLIVKYTRRGIGRLLVLIESVRIEILLL